VPAKLAPEVALKIMVDAGFSPFTPYTNSRTNWKSRCLKCKKITTPRLNDVVQGKRCGHCAGVIPDLKKIMQE
jgi:rRNA maturation endonuclease Nob1